MLAIERRNNILELVQEQKSVMVTDLSTRFNVTEETIRRDLEKLEKEGMIKRTYGGAVIKDSTQSDLPFKVRETKNMEGKVRGSCAPRVVSCSLYPSCKRSLMVKTPYIVSLPAMQ